MGSVYAFVVDFVHLLGFVGKFLYFGIYTRKTTIVVQKHLIEKIIVAFKTLLYYYVYI